MKNKRIRTEMVKAGINQTQLSEILSIPPAELSVMLKYELAAKEQEQIVSVIREWNAVRA